MKLKINPSLILTIVGSAGVVATAITFARASVKAEKFIEENDISKDDKKELAKKLAPIYAPAVAVGVGTIGCIIGVAVLDKKQQASLASAYALVENSYKKYRNKLKELFGEEADKQIRSSLANDAYEAEPPEIHACTLLYDSSDDIYAEAKNENEIVLYDEYSQRFFKSKFINVLEAEYHINRNSILRGYASINEFYEFLGIEQVKGGNDICWAPCDGWLWIDFSHERVDLNGEHYYIIHFNTPFYCEEDTDLDFRELQQETSETIIE